MWHSADYRKARMFSATWWPFLGWWSSSHSNDGIRVSFTELLPSPNIDLPHKPYLETCLLEATVNRGKGKSSLTSSSYKFQCFKQAETNNHSVTLLNLTQLFMWSITSMRVMKFKQLIHCYFWIDLIWVYVILGKIQAITERVTAEVDFNVFA